MHVYMSNDWWGPDGKKGCSHTGEARRELVTWHKRNGADIRDGVCVLMSSLYLCAHLGGPQQNPGDDKDVKHDRSLERVCEWVWKEWHICFWWGIDPMHRHILCQKLRRHLESPALVLTNLWFWLYKPTSQAIDAPSKVLRLKASKTTPLSVHMNWYATVWAQVCQVGGWDRFALISDVGSRCRSKMRFWQQDKIVWQEYVASIPIWEDKRHPQKGIMYVHLHGWKPLIWREKVP